MIGEKQGVPEGEFYASNDDSTEPKNEFEGYEAKSSPDLVAKYLLFKDTFRPKLDVVYYPACSGDVSPSSAFPDSRIVYVDIDDKTITKLQQAGFEAHNSSAKEFDPGMVDVLLLINSGTFAGVPTSHLIENGYILSNDHTRTATELHQDNNYKLKAIIRESREGKMIVTEDNLEDYWKDVDAEDEFKKTALYPMASRIVQKVTGKKENILSEYKKLINIATEQEWLKKGLIDRDTYGHEQTDSDRTKNSIVTLTYSGGELSILRSLPRKIGNTGDIFVYQKVAHTS